MRSGLLEITDLLWSLDADGQRVPVVVDDVVEQLLIRGQRRAAAIVRTMPAIDGHLDPDYVDRLGLRVHCELQRLAEELQMGRRVTELLVARVRRLQDSGPGPIRVVDIGCGLGYVIRSMAARAAFDDEVELVGVDLNPVLIQEARDLAIHEGLLCRFVRGDALRPGVAIEDGLRTIVISTGLLHHLNESDLVAFFAGQAAQGVEAFAHWDIAPCFWSTLGAWVFHQARMREPVSRHDGVLSARRAYPATVLESAARSGAPAYACEVREGSRWHPRALDVLRPVVGVRS
ncbi:MAG: methyltransferase domain-containing protein [Nocardioidaceae bacterium]